MHTQPHTSFATVFACAVLAVFVLTPAALADSAAPAFPSAVPSRPGAVTGSNSATNAALAQERYYTSYGTPAPLTPLGAPADAGGVDWAAIGIAIGATCLLAGTPTVLLMRTRRRTGRARIVA